VTAAADRRRELGRERLRRHRRRRKLDLIQMKIEVPWGTRPPMPWCRRVCSRSRTWTTAATARAGNSCPRTTASLQGRHSSVIGPYTRLHRGHVHGPVIGSLLGRCAGGSRPLTRSSGGQNWPENFSFRTAHNENRAVFRSLLGSV
jgi:hypothetical protein